MRRTVSIFQYKTPADLLIKDANSFPTLENKMTFIFVDRIPEMDWLT